MVSSDSKFYNYEATSPGFSTFAIVIGEDKPVAEVPTNETNIAAELVEKAIESEPTLNRWFFVVLIIVILLAAAELVHLHKKPDEKTKTTRPQKRFRSRRRL